MYENIAVRLKRIRDSIDVSWIFNLENGAISILECYRPIVDWNWIHGVFV